MEVLKPNHQHFSTPRMNTHKNASLTPKGRAHLIEQIALLCLITAAEAAGISTRTARKWQRRFAAEGPAGLHDRSSCPSHSPRQSDPCKMGRAVALRRTQRLNYAQIAERVACPAALWPVVASALAWPRAHAGRDPRRTARGCGE